MIDAFHEPSTALRWERSRFELVPSTSTSDATKSELKCWNERLRPFSGNTTAR